MFRVVLGSGVSWARQLLWEEVLVNRSRDLLFLSRLLVLCHAQYLTAKPVMS